jgi:methionyl-tRNA formyltransferase
MGMTVHRMTGDIDAGPVLAQANGLPIPTGSPKSFVNQVS